MARAIAINNILLYYIKGSQPSIISTRRAISTPLLLLRSYNPTLSLHDMPLPFWGLATDKILSFRRSPTHSPTVHPTD